MTIVTDMSRSDCRAPWPSTIEEERQRIFQKGLNTRYEVLKNNENQSKSHSIESGDKCDLRIPRLNGLPYPMDFSPSPGLVSC
jgi:hypothetical protein